ncbi:MAG: nucleotidyltransferase domain-containing protein [Melioribacteraceae bacterium]|nr:nucleotidyltransferase domain-containing protein [Melioribacteraceae bacterium]MCF8355981.1 nucleotidyltransferase domain-containing protein [Melioribacteraceae bacterium]MCF8394613.1 nucleotidyltransferase domain-containing protein [Melioribacteraceae bacterium]MCF8419610.1 nucleotidyltransferase domain-containing protein [Melioribacteraceae bacterium]
MTVKSRESEILTSAVQILVQFLQPERIILFGSRAKGTGYSGSDFDLAIETDKNIDNKSLRRVKEEIDLVAGLHKIDIVEMRKIDTEFKEIILESGRVVYEKGS